MKILSLANSRGRYLKDELATILDCYFVVRYYPGAGIKDCVTRSYDTLVSQNWTQIYCLAGICDISLKDQHSKILSLRHQDPMLALTEYLDILNSAFLATMDCNRAGPKPKCIFAPLTGICLSAYNKHDLHPDDIRNQTILDKTVFIINSEIQNFNTSHNLFTPWTSRIIHLKNRNNFTNHYHKLALDGCHLSPSVVTHWANSLHDAVIKNL